MRPFSLGVTTLMQGLYALLWVIVLFDVASPTFNLDGLPDWSGIQAAVAIVVLLTASAALGVVMHTVSRGLFHRFKLQWMLEVLSSSTVRDRMRALGGVAVFSGGPKYDDLIEAEGPGRVHRAAAFMHAVEFSILSRAYDVYRTVQVYRDQYRLARGFILPSAAFAIVLPLWEPVKALDSAGAIGPFPIIRTQLFLLSILAAAVSYVAFRERSYRYAAAKLLAFATLEGRRSAE
jgi:hypothetical protein